MRRPVGVPMLLAILLSLGLLPGRGGAAITGATSQDLLVLRTTDGAGGALLTMAAGGHAGHRLPLGLLDRGGHLLYAATVRQDGQSLVRAIDVASGRTLRSLVLQGLYLTGNGDGVTSLVYGAGGAGSGGTQSIAPAALTTRPARGHGVRHPARVGVPVDLSEMMAILSFNGRWLALRDEGSQAVTILETRSLHVAATLTLPTYLIGLDAISDDGHRLYLIESLQGYGTHAYQVRLYDLQRRVLDPTPVRDRGETPGSMDGVAWTRAWAPDGTWLYTLYVHPNGTGAFIHALSLRGRVAHCIDFPDNAVPATVLARYTLAVTPDGRSLYAINPLLGRAVAVRGLPYAPPRATPLSKHSGSPQRSPAGAALSPDGRTMFVATDQGVWAVATASFAVSTTYLAGQKIASVALSDDGRRLYALTAVQQGAVVRAVALPSGQVLGSLPTQTGAWAIAHVTRG